MTRALLFSLTLLAAAPAWADVVYLKNGRALEGTLERTTKTDYHLRVPGGVLKLPRHTIKRVLRMQSAEDEYATRYRKTDKEDPAAIERLAFWASARGLGRQAIQLRSMAKGIRLRLKVERIREAHKKSKTKTAQPWIDLYVWADEQQLSPQVRRWIVEQALAAEPKHPKATKLLRLLNVQRRLKQVADRISARPEEDPRVTRLETKLAEQRDKTKALQDRLTRLERRDVERRRERRGHVRIGSVPNPCYARPRYRPRGVVVYVGPQRPVDRLRRRTSRRPSYRSRRRPTHRRSTRRAARYRSAKTRPAWRRRR